MKNVKNSFMTLQNLTLINFHYSVFIEICDHIDNSFMTYSLPLFGKPPKNSSVTYLAPHSDMQRPLQFSLVNNHTSLLIIFCTKTHQFHAYATVSPVQVFILTSVLCLEKIFLYPSII